ncbi:MAG TPA: EamA family transporter RarD [Chthoniobacterales bacterium]|nr:EamA family transporter RarD [Chthoniobacterales bacterium]
MSSSTSEVSKEDRSALIAGIAAFGFWGIIPIYWKWMASVPASQSLAHRVVWTVIFLIVLLSWKQRWGEVLSALKSRRATWYCLASGAAISLNWLVFIWAVNANHVLETSLGYFMTPLVNVLFGAVFLRERLTRLQLASVLLATAAVLNLTLGYGRFPWIAVVLAVSFGLYGLLRKVSGTAATPGLFIETLLMVPVAIGYLLFQQLHGTLFFGSPHWTESVLLLTTGAVTGLPLVWFGHAARHLRLTTLGFLQYIAPSFTFFLSIFLYDEPFTPAHLITFALIWVALAMFTAETVRRWRSARIATATAARIGEASA